MLPGLLSSSSSVFGFRVIKMEIDSYQEFKCDYSEFPSSSFHKMLLILFQQRSSSLFFSNSMQAQKIYLQLLEDCLQ